MNAPSVEGEAGSQGARRPSLLGELTFNLRELKSH